MIFVGERGPASGEVGDLDLFVHEPVHRDPECLDDLARVKGAGLGLYCDHDGRDDELAGHRSRTRIQVVETSQKPALIEIYPDLFERLAAGGIVDALVPRLPAAAGERHVPRPGVELVLGAPYDEQLQAEVPLAQHQGDGGLPAPSWFYERWPEVGECRCQALEGARAISCFVVCAHGEESTLLCPDAARVIDAGSERMVEEGWNIAICLTDLPIRTDGRPVVATVSTACNVAVLSLPPLGVTLLRQRVREATLQLVNELYEGSPELGRDGEYPEDDEKGDSGEVRRPGFRAHQLVYRRLTELISPIRRITPTNEEDDEVDVCFVSPTVRGHVRFLAGIVLANRPWRLFTTMKGTLAAAFATAAYALVMPIIWQMADSLSWVRLLALMVLAVVAMVVWIIVAHHLWERPAAQEEAREQAALYNASTALTLGVAVLFSYAVLFVLVLLAAGIFLESGFLQSNLGHPVGVSDYVRLAWMATSLATVAGALGSGLEDEETVREATYGYRQQRRNAPNEPEGSADS